MIIGKLPFIIEWMIDNTLLQTNLDSISEQITRPWQIIQDDNQFMWIVRNQEMGHFPKIKNG